MSYKKTLMKANEIIKKIRPSHLIWFGSGTLIPMYADVLFINGINSSTISAIMNTIMVIISIMAIISVKDWLNDKMKHRGFDQADICVKKLSSLKLKSKNLFNYTNSMFSYLIETDTIQNNDETFKSNERKIIDNFLKYCQSFSELTLELDLLKLWNIKINPEIDNEFEKFLESISEFRDTIDDVISEFREPHIIVRRRYWEKNKVSFKEKYTEIKNSHTEITVPFDQLFTYIKN